MTDAQVASIEEVLDKSERLYDPVEVAHILNVKTATVTMYCRSGKMAAHKVNGLWKITKSEVKRFILSGPLPVQENEEAK